MLPLISPHKCIHTQAHTFTQMGIHFHICPHSHMYTFCLETQTHPTKKPPVGMLLTCGGTCIYTVPIPRVRHTQSTDTFPCAKTECHKNRKAEGKPTYSAPTSPRLTGLEKWHKHLNHMSEAGHTNAGHSHITHCQGIQEGTADQS